ncbi:MAG: acyl-CoA dehydrogenase [Robiginitomaculum sp.]|nr:MAG: acyl-CoA dehydrogenase [Robiginitomaculum sp.]
MSDLKEFRLETRTWLEENCPPKMRTPVKSDKDACWGGRNWEFANDDQKLWLDRMAAKGWTSPSWPKEYGGAGLSRAEAKVLQQEMNAIGARSPLSSFGIWMLGPALLKFGTDEQRLRFLPEICRGEIRWCQGYSEPAAGSDLASLATKAEDKGDHFLVNGQKIWTSYADQADWIFCLVRTDNTGKKHHGISFVLFDMESKGVTTKPILLISGRSPFCETFFEDVQVPKENLVGDLDKGWSIAKYLLTHEREMIGDISGTKTLNQIITEKKYQLGPMLRARVAEYEVDEWAFSQTLSRMLSEAKAGASLGAKSSMLKYYGTELNKRKHELLMDITGHDGLEWEGDDSNDGEISRMWLRTKGNSIEGGTSEVQLNIISKHILQLPGA